MKLKTLYELMVKKGMKEDPRPRKVIEEGLKKAKQNYQAARGIDKEVFDKEGLKHPYYDTRILNGSGEEEVKGIVKNISNTATDAAIVANFYGPNNENIGCRVIILRDIKPGNVKQFLIIFKPQDGDIVKNLALSVGELVE